MAYDMRQIRLAHPLREEDAAELALPVRKYQIGEDMVLPYTYAMRLVAAGFVEGAEPARRETHEKSLKRVDPQTPVGAVKPSQTAVAGDSTQPAVAPAKTAKTPARSE